MVQEERQKSMKLSPEIPMPRSDKELEEAYLADLPRRIVLERQYEALSAQLDETEKTPSPKLDKKHNPHIEHFLG